MLRASIAGIMARGNAELGDKTLLDALAPMTDAIEAALAAGEDSEAVVVSAASTARRAADATTPMIYGLTEHYKQIFELTRLDEAIEIYDSEDDALKAAGG